MRREHPNDFQLINSITLIKKKEEQKSNLGWDVEAVESTQWNILVLGYGLRAPSRGCLQNSAICTWQLYNLLLGLLGPIPITYPVFVCIVIELNWAYSVNLVSRLILSSLSKINFLNRDNLKEGFSNFSLSLKISFYQNVKIKPFKVPCK